MAVLAKMAEGGAGAGGGAGATSPPPEIVGLGAATRTVNPSLRRALDARDGGCRFPGCDGRFTEAHHVVHWAEGGKTTLANLVLLCHHHHILLHEGGWRMRWTVGSQGGERTPLFLDPRGGVHHEGLLRRPGAGAHGVERLLQGNAAWQRAG